MAKATPTQTKFVREYYDDDKKLDARWYYDLEKFKNGPILVENLNLPRKQKKSRKQKQEE